MINIASFFKQKVIEETSSSVNGRIQVVNFLGEPRIIVSGLLQSGGLLEVIWGKVIKKIIGWPDFSAKSCLILGLGGGTLANLINQSFPEVKITGVEIDPEIIRLAKKYFGVNKISNLKIINTDAIKFINQEKSPEKFDLIFVDLYLGDKIPSKTETAIFMSNLKKLLSKSGIIVFNRLFYEQHKKGTEKFVKQLGYYFSNIELVRVHSNLLVFGSLSYKKTRASS